MSKAKKIYVAKERAGKAISKSMAKKLPKYSKADQQKHYSGDKVFDDLASMKPTRVRWGQRSKARPVK